jgi:AcrR family transcriptional regulator
MAAEKLRTFSKDKELVKERRKFIANKAVKLFLKKGYLKTSIREIATFCEMGLGTLYHYIGTKDDILALVREEFSSFFEEIQTTLEINNQNMSSTDKLRKFIKQYLEVVDKNQDIFVFWYQETKNLPPDERKELFKGNEIALNIAEEILVEGCKRGEFKNINTTLLAADISVLGDMWAFMRWYLRKRFTLEEFTNDQTEIILSSVKY